MMPPKTAWSHALMGTEVRHLARVQVHGSVLAMLLSGENHYIVVAESVPPDAHLIDARYAGWAEMVDLYFEHPSLPATMPGSLPVILTPNTLLTACSPHWGYEQPEWEIG
jgi:hypothetical protein